MSHAKNPTESHVTQQAPVPTADDLADMPIAQLQAAVNQAIAALDKVASLLPNPTRLTTAERKIIGRLKNGESAVLQKVGDVAAMPAYAPMVASLGDMDYGDDPKKFEPELCKERLQRADLLAPLADKLESLAQDMSDTAFDLQHLGSEPLRAAYRVLRPVARTDATLKSLLKDVADYYEAIARAAAKTRAAKKHAPAGPTAPTTATPAVGKA